MERSILVPNRRSISTLLCASLSSHIACGCGSPAANIIRRNKRPFRRSSLPSANVTIATRVFHSNAVLNNTTRTSTETHQAHPHSGYYSDLLSFHYPQNTTKAAATSSVSNKESAEGRTTSSEPTKEEKMSIVFGTRLAGPGYQSTRYNPETMPPESTWKTINGVPIPPRPTEPDNCCMSGCVHCVWDDYRDDLEHWAGRVRHAHANAKAKSTPNMKTSTGDMRQTPRREVANASVSMDDDGGGSETNWDMASTTAGVDGEDLFAGIPVGIREFMKTEKKLREQKHQQQ